MSKSTFVMLKPDAVEAELESEILAIFKAHSIEVVRSKSVIVDEPLILEHYAEVIQRVPIEDFAQRILRAFKGKTVRIFEMTSGRDDIVDAVRKIIGPTDPLGAPKESIRGRFGTDSLQRSKDEKRMLNNLIHASDSDESAQKELKLWFK